MIDDDAKDTLGSELKTGNDNDAAKEGDPRNFAANDDDDTQPRSTSTPRCKIRRS